MAATRDDLRDHLTAVIEASQELGKDDRSYLAENFIDELERQYQLVPRSQTARAPEFGATRSTSRGPALGQWPRTGGMTFFLPALLLPFLLVSLFVFAHPPFFLFAFVLFALFRFGGFGGRRRGPWRQGPRGRDVESSYL